MYAQRTCQNWEGIISDTRHETTGAVWYGGFQMLDKTCPLPHLKHAAFPVGEIWRHDRHVARLLAGDQRLDLLEALRTEITHTYGRERKTYDSNIRGMHARGGERTISDLIDKKPKKAKKFRRFSTQRNSPWVFLSYQCKNVYPLGLASQARRGRVVVPVTRSAPTGAPTTRRWPRDDARCAEDKNVKLGIQK